MFLTNLYKIYIKQIHKIYLDMGLQESRDLIINIHLGSHRHLVRCGIGVCVLEGLPVAIQSKVLQTS